MKTKYSIIIPTYNRSDEVLLCIKSLLKILREDYEIIVVDDCSTDDTVNLIHNINSPKIRVEINEKNSGASFSRNQGAKIAKGDYIFFLDSDTEVDNKILEGFDNTIKNYNNIGLIAPIICYFEEKDRIWYAGAKINLITSQAIYRGTNEKNLSSYKNTEILIGGHAPTAFVVPKEVFLKVGGFDEIFFIMYEESDLAMKIESLGKNIFFEPKSIVYHKIPVPENRRGIIGFLKNIWFRNSKIAFYTSRNRIIFMKNHSKNFYLFISIFMPVMLSIYTIQCLFNWRLDLLLNIFRGTLDGIILILKQK